MAKYLTRYNPTPFSTDTTTERGEAVYKTLEVTLIMPDGIAPIRRVLTCSAELGITEEFIEDTIKGCQNALEKDFPTDEFKLVRLKPNRIRFEYVGTKGWVQ